MWHTYIYMSVPICGCESGESLAVAAPCHCYETGVQWTCQNDWSCHSWHFETPTSLEILDVTYVTWIIMKMFFVEVGSVFVCFDASSLCADLLPFCFSIPKNNCAWVFEHSQMLPAVDWIPTLAFLPVSEKSDLQRSKRLVLQHQLFGNCNGFAHGWGRGTRDLTICCSRHCQEFPENSWRTNMWFDRMRFVVERFWIRSLPRHYCHPEWPSAPRLLNVFI